MRMPVLAALLLAGPALAAAPAVHPGEMVYRNLCQSCHMADARGGLGVGRIPALAGNTRLAGAEYPIIVVTGGKGAMPWFRGDLTDQQIADVIGYVRSHFGNRYKDKVTAAQIAEMGIAAPKMGDNRP